MKFSAMFYTAFDLNGVREVGIFFFPLLQNRKGQSVIFFFFAIKYNCFSTGEPNKYNDHTGLKTQLWYTKWQSAVLLKYLYAFIWSIS